MKPFSEYLSREERRSILRDEQWRIERDRRRTREERKMRRLATAINTLLVVLFLILTAVMACTDAESTEAVEEAVEPVVVAEEPDVTLIGVDVNAEAQEPMTYEDHFREVAEKVENCMLTHYCTELRPHICGTGDGLTSTGVPVTAYWSCAVDPSVIPYGAEVMVDYGDEVQFWKAQDCGPWVKGNHIDLAVETHAEAETLGIKYATVYWAMPEDLNVEY
jgi:3D (Asp-Asp-Asp) domain-containing protein